MTPTFSMPRGTVVRLDRQRGFGFVETERGATIFFYLPTVDFIGGRGPRDLEVGTVVGYDVTLTSKGERITKMRIHDPEPVSTPSA